jgi:hypothetical protein
MRGASMLAAGLLPRPTSLTSVFFLSPLEAPQKCFTKIRFVKNILQTNRQQADVRFPRFFCSSAADLRAESREQGKKIRPQNRATQQGREGAPGKKD